MIGPRIRKMATFLTEADGTAGALRRPVVGALAAHLGATWAAWLVIGGLAVTVASAWFNRGFLSYDEHFQILEFAWYKLGRAPAETLAWEFREHMRPGLQPLMVAWAARGLESLGLFTPFVLAFLLRLASGLLAVWVSLALAARVLPAIQSKRLKVALVGGSLFLWFLPFSHVRFSSDNWGGLLFFAGVCLLLDAIGEASPEAAASGARGRATATQGGRLGAAAAIAPAAAAGLLWGLAFYCRYQVGFAIAGAGCWLLIVRRTRPAVLAALAVSFLMACAVGTLADRWLYDAWVLTPYEYVRANLFEGKAATFGVEPWWFYGGQILLFLVPPFSVVLVGVLGAAVWHGRRQLLVWTTLPFLVGHSLVAHKEVRFLIPITYALVPLLVMGADRIAVGAPAMLARWAGSRAGRYGARGFVALNLIVLAVMTVKPSHETEVMFRWLWDASAKQPITVYTATDSPYRFLSLEICFYRSPNTSVRNFETTEDLRRAAAARPGRVFFFHRSFLPPDWLAASGLDVTPVARTLPQWTTRVNVNNWVSRMRVWTVFSIRVPSTTGGRDGLQTGPVGDYTNVITSVAASR
jgi:phosphatidylinositol glycan class B